MQKILIVEDDESILMGLENNLKFEGYRVITARDGERGLTLAREQHPDLILLDLMLPRRDGYDVCRALNADKIDIPIIMLTAKDKEMDKVVGLELGADDYVTKPFSLRELLARIRSLLRRTQKEKKQDVPIYTFGPFKFDFKSYEAFQRGKKLRFTPREFKIMRYFIQRRGEVVSRFDLLDNIWGYDVYPSTRTVDNHIARLRRIIEKDPRKPQYILSIRGVGYKFTG